MKNDKFKKIVVSSFLSFIFIVPVTMLFTEDKTINEIENKILKQFPRFNYSNVISGRFMDELDEYISDQFPGRNLFLYGKNKINYLLGSREFRGVYISKSGRLLERFDENKDVLNYNIEKINLISNNINTKNDLFLVPNSIAIYNDELPSYFLNDSQEISISNIKKGCSINVYSPLDVLKSHKNDYIYYNTDHHWTQLGAKIAFEDFYKTKVDSKYSLVNDSFLGTYYSKVMLNSIKPDSIYAYKDFNNFESEFDGTKYKTLYDDKKLDGKNKYQYFLNGDLAQGVVYGKGEGEILVIKDSFAHAFIPFLTTKYDKIHVIDPRYSKEDIVEYVNKHDDIKEVMFLLSLSTLNSSKLF